MMKNKKNLLVLSVVALTGISTLAGCKNKKGNDDDVFFGYSLGIQSGLKTLEIGGEQQYLKIYDNGIDTAGREYTFSSTDDEVATVERVDAKTAKIVLHKAGSVNFKAMESKSGEPASLGGDIEVIENVSKKASGGFNFATTIDPEHPYQQKEEILGALEKYAIDSHLTGITLFDNASEVKYSPRVKFAFTDPKYISGYGFGLLYDGEIDKARAIKGIPASDPYADYYHTAFSQNPMKINQYTATGSEVSDLASYITSTYWATRRSSKPAEANSKYEWYPCLATDEIYLPTVGEGGAISGYAKDKSPNGAPVPMEETNSMGLYKKWRVYVKAANEEDGRNDSKAPIRFHNTYCTNTARKAHFDNMAVTIDDYEFAYMLLLTGKNNLIRGTEMANDTSHGIKGAQRFFNDTKDAKITDDEVEAKWNEYKNSNKLGIHTGFDKNGAYIDIELINAIDAFTAMYTLSSSLVSPLPKEFFIGNHAIKETMELSAKNYGTFAGTTNDNEIINNTIACGPYQLEEWLGNEQVIKFKRNDDWFEHSRDGKYKIAGLYQKKVDTTSDSEKIWKEFNESESLDVAGIPVSMVGKVEGTLQTEGDSTFKLNINACDQARWNQLKNDVFPEGTKQYTVKPWMSNSHFLDGLFFAINRKEFAEKRGVQPSLNYFSDAYLIDPKNGLSYNGTDAHKKAINYYHTISSTGDNYGFDYARAVDNFRIAVNELSASNDIKLKTKEDPTEINIHIRWMYQTDINEYGEDICSYIEKAFNDPAVCGGKVKLKINQEAVTNWEDVYNEYMMKGNFDLAFGAISGNTYDPLNFLEVLKSDNSSSFTLNWGADTGSASGKNPIVYKGSKWSFDSLWETADHGGIVSNGEKVQPVEVCKVGSVKKDGSAVSRLTEGFNVEIPLEFVDLGNETDVKFNFEKLDVYVEGKGNVTLENAKYEDGKIKATVDATTANEINDKIKQAMNYDTMSPAEQAKDANKYPFDMGNYGLGKKWSFEVYYELKIGSTSTEGYAPVTLS